MTAATNDPYPLLFEPILKEKVWGGRRLERWGKALPPGVRIGESWELADLAATSAGGGGGGAAHSRIANGPLAGATIRDAIERWGERLLGDVELTRSRGFPLLVKYLDAREHLSVQVHPSPAYAADHPDAHLKAESWYVLDAEPGSVIYKGLRPGVTLHDIERALTTTEHGSGVVELLQTHEARVGDLHNLPSGTVHALGAGVLVAEVQTPSDTTFRVYDWAKEYARAARDLHVEQALASLLIETPPPSARLPEQTPLATLVRSPHFEIAEARPTPAEPLPLARVFGPAPAPVVVMPLIGGLRVHAEGRAHDLPQGQTALIPAVCARDATLEGEPTARVLLARPSGP